MREPLTLDTLKMAARAYSVVLAHEGVEALYGVTDGKAVGTYVETRFKDFIDERYEHTRGSAAKGMDFPGLNVDLKVTSIRQPQSSCPFRNAAQKVYGLGYHLLVMVYEKSDDSQTARAYLPFRHVLFIESTYTADHQTTKGIRDLLQRDANVDDLDGFLEDRNLPLDDVGRRQLAERIFETPPEQGVLTISNALQWRLQYGRAIQLSAQGGYPTVEDILGEQ